jgi:hypothetical protein
MPTYERRFFLGQKTKEVSKQEEQMEQAREQSDKRNSKGSRTSRVSGDALKTRMQNGDIPLS